MNRTGLIAWCAAAVLLLSASVNMAQKAESGRRGSTSAATPAVSDAELATWLIIDNRMEIEFAQYAREKAGSENVREFAAKMAEDHSQFVQKLQDAAGLGTEQRENQRPRSRRNRNESGSQGESNRRPTPRGETSEAIEDAAKTIRQVSDDTREPVAAEDRSRERDSTRRPNRLQREGNREIPAPFHGEAAGVPAGLLALKQELSQKQLDSIKSALDPRQGANFDIAYVNQQVMAHMNMLDALRVFQRHASSQELKQVLKQGEQATQEHLRLAQNLAEKVDQKEN